MLYGTLYLVLTLLYMAWIVEYHTSAYCCRSHASSPILPVLYCKLISVICQSCLSYSGTRRTRRHHWRLIDSGMGSDVALPPSYSMEQAQDSVQIVGEVEFRSDSKSKQLKAVSGTEWMYRRGALERGRQVCVCVCVWHVCLCVCVSLCVCV